MRTLRRYIPSLFTLLLIGLGAAMPWLVSGAQDARISGLEEHLELNAVSLTLRQDAGVEAALDVIAREYVSVSWTDETRMAEWEALDAASRALDEMTEYDLLPVWVQELRASEPDSWAEPVLAVAEDGETALVWNCFWNTVPCVVTVDDVSGKAVRFLMDGAGTLLEYDNTEAKEQAARWELFFQDYYGAELAEKLHLDLYEDYTSFNFSRSNF